MTTERIIALAKEKLGKDITEQEAQGYLDGKIAIPDEALDLVSGGASCSLLCPKCNSETLIYNNVTGLCECYVCHNSYNPRECVKGY